MIRVVVPRAYAHDLCGALDRVAVQAEVRCAAGMRDEDLAPLLPGADALVCQRFSRSLAQPGADLRLIQTTGAGTNEVEIDALSPHVTVCNVYGHGHGVAEYVCMTMLALTRDLAGLDRRLRQGDWGDRRPQPELRDKTVLVIGLGHIGVEVARLASAFRMRVVGVTRSLGSRRAADVDCAQIVELPQLHAAMGDADFIVVAVPLESDTRGLIGAAELSLMKPTAFLINVARGPVVDERALYQALRTRAIAGAAIDVWYQYPERDGQTCQPSHLPFNSLDNVLMTPHLAGWTEGTARFRWSAIAENLARLDAGEPLANVVRAPAWSHLS